MEIYFDNSATTRVSPEAARRALENSGVKPEELDLILAATVSNEDVSPSLACMIQHHLGATCPAYDINAACPAFIFLLETAAENLAAMNAIKDALDPLHILNDQKSYIKGDTDHAEPF